MIFSFVMNKYREDKMFDDEITFKKQDKLKDLEPMSLDELDNYIKDLKEEISRSENEIKRKKTHMDAASSVFKN